MARLKDFERRMRATRARLDTLDELEREEHREDKDKVFAAALDFIVAQVSRDLKGSAYQTAQQIRRRLLDIAAEG